MMKQKTLSHPFERYKTNSKNNDFPINLLSDPSNFKEHISCFNLPNFTKHGAIKSI